MLNLYQAVLRGLNRAGTVLTKWTVRLLQLSLLQACLLSGSQVLAIDPVAYTAAPPPKAEGILSKNYKLCEAVLMAKGKLKGPEDIAFDKEGRIYTGSSSNGKIYRITTTNNGAEKVELFADPGGGMTLGLMFNKNDELIACNCPKGLLSIDNNGKVSCLTRSSANEKIFYADDLDIAMDGKIYFSSATKQSQKHGGDKSMFVDLLESRPYGQLFVYDPAAKSTVSLLGGLYFANGVALSPNEDFVLVNESYRYRVTRYWLKGPKAGSSDIFADNLPGMTDGIIRDKSGGYWVSIVVPRSAYIDYVQERPKLKKLFSHLPQIFWGRMQRYGMVLKLDESGKITDNLQDPTGRIWSVTNAVPWKNSLYLGSLRGKAIARYDLSKEQ